MLGIENKAAATPQVSSQNRLESFYKEKIKLS
jgi:hypothetical protein